ncbi:leucyl aminopeptidase [Singulisphaera sp. GP187]|uniref:leucyl aminopeptidase n=1 Tax=Singulisphaera sp. GP187 TaxID=1882752 RepID=UPI000926001B|nr:leucyl aminopeptidase [Singulisphaera sp. GP187]SIN77791.1 leucyl aminopeptidase [Singulisphaera sp. GP187]
MNVQSIRRSLSAIETPWLALGIFEGESEPPLAVRELALGEWIGRLVAAKELSGGLGDLTPLLGAHTPATEGVLIFGLGPKARFDAGAAFAAGVAVGKRLAGKPRESVSVVLPEADRPDVIASALVEGLIVGTQGPGLRKTEPSRHPFGTLQLISPPNEALEADLAAAVERGGIVGQAVNLARELTNTPPSEKPPTKLAARAAEVAVAAGLGVSVWDEPKIREEQFGGLLGVAAGSAEPPAFVVLDYRQGGDRPTLALVGKGVTFDSGGLSLKPSASMEDMKSDMTGAAVVLATLVAVAQLKLPVNLVGYMVMTENMTGGKAMKLGDVLSIRNGKTVEVLNTDAEGRLILADALSYAVEQKPARVLNLATLTGACLVAVGTKIAGLFSNDDSFAQEVQDAGRQTGERTWRLPLDEDFKDAIKSQVADLKNVGGKWGGASTAAKFLEQFVGQTAWVHLDIAGPSWADADSATRDAGGTGCFVRTLVALVEASLRKQ